jgi:hypothetical protein
MDRTEFEALRDLSGKLIEGDVRLASSSHLGSVLAADDIPIRNSANTGLILNLTYLRARRGFKINVHVRGVGPICRLEVNGPEHPGATRTHKHALRTNRCPNRNLHADVTARPELQGKTMRDVWRTFCEMASITHQGDLLCEGIDPATEIL